MEIENILIVGSTKSEFIQSLLNMSTYDCSFVHISHLKVNDIINSNLIIYFDHDNNSEYLEFCQQECLLNNIPIMYVLVNELELSVGPTFVPSKQGCIFCMKAQKDVTKYSDYKRYIHIGTNNLLSNKFIRENMRLFIEKEIDLLAQFQSPSTSNKVVVFSNKTMNIVGYPLVPNQNCEHCASFLKEDNRNDALLTLHDRLKVTKHEFRQKNPLLDLHDLRNLLTNKKFGLINKIEKFPGDIIPTYFSYTNQDVFIGRQNNFFESELTSYLEALERDAGKFPKSKRTSIFKSYEELKGQAVNPIEFGLSKDSSDQYSEMTSLPWVWGYSFKYEDAILVPEQIAYFANHIVSPQDKRFVIESSNGCSLGKSLEESILHGLFEVIERDAFLLMWHGMQKPVAIRLETVKNDEILNIKNKINSLGFDVFVLKTTTEFGIPSFAAIVVNKNHIAPRVFVSGGCHLIAEEAILSCLFEASAHTQMAKKISEHKKERVEELYKNPRKIRSLEDHYLYYYHPKNFSKFNFIFNNMKFVDFKEFIDSDEEFNLDITKDLTKVIKRILDHDYDVIAINQTPSYLEQFDLRASKVLIPGLLQLGVGLQGDRATNQPRLKKHSNTINMAIHPFP
ncbi:TOMM precursor leader peptide-binding protein [Pseudalkalibacillus sp. JSM 102089]|uniref:TOMM precursor leader peptide-binding protein n=1 Tax=Pseudalkalibacillus sp. JSM 102089 TaxID=3229856 RepID=UPI00352397FC